jgi:hypothetical protein
MEQNTGSDTAVPWLGEDCFDPLEAGVRQRIRSFIEQMLEAELETVLNQRRVTGMVTASGRSSALSARLRCRCRGPGWSEPTARPQNGKTGRCPPTSG